MATDLAIRDAGDELRVLVKTPSSPMNGVLAALAAAAFVAIAFSRLARLPVLIAATAFAACVSYIVNMRARQVHLCVTAQHFTSDGFCGDNFRRRRMIASDDVRWLEYQEDTTGPETSHHPGGVYAITSLGSICVLPYVNERQSATVIQQIMIKYPEMAKHWQQASPYGKHFTTLRLG